MSKLLRLRLISLLEKPSCRRGNSIHVNNQFKHYLKRRERESRYWNDIKVPQCPHKSIGHKECLVRFGGRNRKNDLNSPGCIIP